MNARGGRITQSVEIGCCVLLLPCLSTRVAAGCSAKPAAGQTASVLLLVCWGDESTWCACSPKTAKMFSSSPLNNNCVDFKRASSVVNTVNLLYLHRILALAIDLQKSAYTMPCTWFTGSYVESDSLNGHQFQRKNALDSFGSDVLNGLTILNGMRSPGGSFQRNCSRAA